MKVVESSPEKFEVFISILSAFPWLQHLVESICKQHEANMKSQAAVRSSIIMFLTEFILLFTSVGRSGYGDAIKLHISSEKQ